MKCQLGALERVECMTGDTTWIYILQRNKGGQKLEGVAENYVRKGEDGVRKREDGVREKMV